MAGGRLAFLVPLPSHTAVSSGHNIRGRSLDITTTRFWRVLEKIGNLSAIWLTKSFRRHI